MTESLQCKISNISKKYIKGNTEGQCIKCLSNKQIRLTMNQKQNIQMFSPMIKSIFSPNTLPSLIPEIKNNRLLITTKAGKITGKISLALEAGKANPAPPVGPALGAKGVNIMQFCKEYNAKTSDKQGQIIPVEIIVYEDKSFTFTLKTPPASFLIKKAAGIQKGSSKPGVEKVGQITRDQLKEIAEAKLPDLNCTDMEAAMRTIEGTAKNMGVTIVTK